MTDPHCDEMTQQERLLASVSDWNAWRSVTREVCLSGADLSKANLSGANLGGAGLSEANLSGADLGGADLSEANLGGADLGGANLAEANLSWASLHCTCLNGACLRGANLSGAYLAFADLRGAALGGANLAEANLSRADLIKADLSRANLNRAYLAFADLSGANLSGAKGLLCQSAWLRENCEWRDGQVVAYKTFGEHFVPPPGWRIEPGSVITEVCSFDRTQLCASGINVATLSWCWWHADGPVWEVLVDPSGVCVPYHTDGKFRAERVTLVQIVK